MDRSNVSPMQGIEWANQHGPVDPTSPFSKLAMKRSHSIFNSPPKSEAPALREPKSQHFLFSQSADSQPQSSEPSTSPYRAPSFTTPRKPIEIDFSSGPENTSSPEQADNEETPEVAKQSADFIGKDGKPCGKRNSLFNFYGRFAPSSGRGEIARPTYSNAIAKRIHKKRRLGQNFAKQIALARRTSEDSDDDHGSNTPQQPYTQLTSQKLGGMASLFAFIEQYPNAPALISKYLQTFFTAAILWGGLYVIYSIWSTIRADVDRASEDSTAEILAEMASCAKNYVENRCAGDSRLPALEAVCNNWELCMNRDSNGVRRAQVSAHTFAQIINSFVEPISLKTTLLFGFTIIISLLITNTTLGALRRSQDAHNYHVPLHPSALYMHPPHNPVMPHYYATPGPGHTSPFHQQIRWATGHDVGKNQQSIEYPENPSKKQRTRSRSPEKRLGTK